MVFTMMKADICTGGDKYGEKRKGTHGDSNKAQKKTQTAPAASSVVHLQLN